MNNLHFLKTRAA